MSTATAHCTSTGNTLVPTALARSPWGQTIAGHVVGGLLARAVEGAGGDSEFQPTRLTVDLIRPSALKPVEVVANIVHGGRRIRLVDATLIQEGSIAARASLDFSRGLVGRVKPGPGGPVGLIVALGREGLPGVARRAGFPGPVGFPRVVWAGGPEVRGMRPEVVAMLGRSRRSSARWRRSVTGFGGRRG